ncbi:hypothetical protein BSG18_27920 [Pseudomonas ogarae]|nr:hypothetical protein BSG18_27920 [Pseudomonas ogarae]
MNLYGRGADFLGHFRGEQLGHGRFHQRRLAAVPQGGGVVHHLPGHGDLGRHVCQAERHGLVLDDRLAETGAFPGIVPGRLERRAGHAHRLRRDAHAPAFQVRQGDLVTLALLTQAIAHRHLHILEEDLAGVGGVLAEFVFDPGHAVARRIGRHDERTDATLAGARIGHRKHNHHSGVLPGRDELLATVEHVMITLQPRPRLEAAGVRTGLGLGQGKGAKHRATGQGSEEFRLLFIVAELEDWHATHRVVDAHQRPGGTVARGDFLHR